MIRLERLGQVLCAHGAELVVVEAANETELSVGQNYGEGMIKSEHCQWLLTVAK